MKTNYISPDVSCKIESADSREVRGSGTVNSDLIGGASPDLKAGLLLLMVSAIIINHKLGQIFSLLWKDI